MAIIQLDIESRLPYGPATDGHYYWTNTYFYNDAIQPSDNPTYYWVGVAHERACLTVVQISAQKRTSPPGSGIYVGGGVSSNPPGDLTFTGGWSPYDIGRLTFWSGGKAVGYKLWRMPVPNNQIVNGNELTPWAWSALDNACGILLHALITTRDGTPIDNITSSHRVHQWSYRHGTKRRDRRVLTFP